MGDDLLIVALDLASRARTSSPRQAFLRRAASTAYYAVFQKLAERCASTFVTYSGSDWETYTLVYRGLDHSSARKIFESRSIESAFGVDIARLAGSFVELQQARTSADYLPGSFPYGQSKIGELLEQARAACQIIETIPTPLMRRLAAQLIIKRR